MQHHARFFSQPELVDKYVEHLSSHDDVYELRLVNTEIRGFIPKLTFPLSRPAPHKLFALRWGHPDALRGLTWAQRRALPVLVATSGDRANLSVLLERGDVDVLSIAVFHAAARAGHVDVCQLLMDHNCPSKDADVEAAKAGQAAVCDLFRSDPIRLAAAAAAGGHMELMVKYMREITMISSDDSRSLAEAIVRSFPTAETQLFLHNPWRTSQINGDFVEHDVHAFMIAAAMSVDYMDKLRLVRRYMVPDVKPLLSEVIAIDSDFERFRWLEACGEFTFDRDHCLVAFIKAGNLPAVSYVRKLLSDDDLWSTYDEGFHDDDPFVVSLWSAAACRGDMVMLELLEAERVPMTNHLQYALDAAHHGHSDAVAWLLARLDPTNRDDSDDDSDDSDDEGRGAWRREQQHGISLEWAYESPSTGSVPLVEWCLKHASDYMDERDLLADALSPRGIGTPSEVRPLLEWLVARGSLWSTDAFANATVQHVDELEWMVAQGCPMDDEAYVRAAAAGDVHCLKILRRLNCPWTETTMARAAVAALCNRVEHQEFRGLRWLLESGCPAARLDVDLCNVDLELKLIEVLTLLEWGVII
ncbi:hypothetical protein TSOC_002732 [Tetrabaena socialis]|uniref:Ankyrin repeat domain-containing protein n=1 Tax=Tetrabaena socialis TaxID=47790 RepID=A0A2J8ADD3_9CHLO|nr:hypothetical protein TSOC_002732 [Tetrabaena socialis]|eukprot:PNH10525.1 hypothetical protein TSOC_002732 [Tetrabaena socialis]